MMALNVIPQFEAELVNLAEREGIDPSAMSGAAMPPNSIKSTPHLEDLLLEGVGSSSREITDTDWLELHRRAQDRISN